MSGHAMIALIPIETEWCRQPDPHMTLVYAGKTEDRSPAEFNELAKATIEVARILEPFKLPVTGVEVFGKAPEQVDVLTLYPSPELLIARKMVEQWNRSEYKQYQPHATIGPTRGIYESESSKSYMPLTLRFESIGAYWDDHQMIFPLYYN